MASHPTRLAAAFLGPSLPRGRRFPLIAMVFLLIPALSQAQIRITEALVNPLGSDAGHQVVELANLGGTTLSIAGWRLVSPSGVAVLPAGRTLGPGARYLIHLSADGANDALHYYTGSGFGPVSVSAHSLALYADSGALSDPSALRDFVQWGSPAQANEELAVSAGKWIGGEYVPITSEGNSMQLCGPTATGATAWIEAAPTLGEANNCSSQSESSTWGRLKSFYR